LSNARERMFKDGPNSALAGLQRAVEMYRENNDRRGEANAIGALGYCYEQLADYTKALDYLNQALAMKRELKDRPEEAKTLNNLGLVFWDMSEYPQAIDQFNRSLDIAREIGDRQIEGAVLNNLALVSDEQGDYPHSLDLYRQALDLHRVTHFTRGETDTLGNLGGDYLLLGRYQEAQGYYQQALKIDEAQKLAPSISRDLGNLAVCKLGLGEPEEALRSFDRAQEIARDAGLQKEQADWQRGRGAAYLRMGKYDSARDAYRQAIEVYERAGLKRERIEALNDRGTLLSMLGDDLSAEKDFRLAADLARAIGNPRGVTINLMAIGDLEWRCHRYDQAVAAFNETYQRALDAGDQGGVADSLLHRAKARRDQGLLDDAEKDARQALQISQTTGAKPQEAEADYELGDLARRKGQATEALALFGEAGKILDASRDSELTWQIAYGKGLTLEGMGKDEEALNAYRDSIGMIEEIRNQLKEERFQSGYLNDKYQVYISLIHLLLKVKKLPEAFTYSEKLRAKSFQNLFNGSPMPGSSDKEELLRSQIRQLQREIDVENSKSPQERKGHALSVLSRELAKAEQNYQALLDDLRSKEPGRAALRGLAIPSVESIESALPPHSALLEYVVGKESTSIFVITPGGLDGLTITVTASNLRTKIELFRDLIRQHDSDDWQRPAESLAGILIEPIEKAGWLRDITRLYIVPNSFLYYLPFAALPRPTPSGDRFLIQDYELVSLPTSAALVFSQDPGVPAKKMLVLAPAVTHLRYAVLEASRVQATFPHGSLALVGKSATVNAFQHQAEQFQYIHLATDGFFDKLNPLFSGVQLQPQGQSDGRLEVYEILRMHLRARLVTLSACETGLGSGYFADFPPGDDFVGLTRTFLSAGSSAVLSSLWEVNDRSTLELMGHFYRNLQKEGDAAALRQAQLAMLQSRGRFRRPYYWAAFTLVSAKK
jgi:CHAT domain-containing protein/Tfp pilus assembly protein PilF